MMGSPAEGRNTPRAICDVHVMVSTSAPRGGDHDARCVVIRVNADLSEITCMQVRQVPAPRQQCNASPRHSHSEKLAQGLLT